MGAKSLIIGYIEEPFIKDRQRDALIKDHNRARLFILPRIGEWPRLTRGFFSVSGEEETYANSLIYFGGTFKQIEDDWSEWLDKFEALLRKLIWVRVKLVLETGYHGEHTYTWAATEKAIAALEQELPETVQDWVFRGGPRTFR
jgi:hypothetical protein